MTKLIIWTASIVLIFLAVIFETSALIGKQPQAPNFQYFERPRYRYPYYDENGRGRLLYGYGGSDLYQYKSYSALEGIH
ncbi:uncharacterized protein LOC122498148 [Leptopilina heterotoma]|uniref:uncharacterized protein LOC122498148 n=1 Tax=Leptopilina heterotoma TaxID=63436 RepID=UPI001CA7E2D6|nr:uncharacterized protein LOC122498148 [Leptopilina heterotoma]